MANTRSLSDETALRDENVLRRVRHFCSARDGLREWRLQRKTALALIPLGLYFVASMLRLAVIEALQASANCCGFKRKGQHRGAIVADDEAVLLLNPHSVLAVQPVSNGVTLSSGAHP